jgi:peptide/nickel transport system permease protein
MVLTLWMLATIVFLLVNVLPGDVGRKVLGPTANQVDVDAFNARLGTDRPLIEQYGSSLKNLVTFDFGDSFQTGNPVLDLLWPALGRSAKLALLAFVITIPLSIAAGIFAARRQDRVADRVVVNAGFASSSLPEFVTATVLLAVFAVQIGWGRVNANVPDGTSLVGQLEYLLLPGDGARGVVLRLHRPHDESRRDHRAPRRLHAHRHAQGPEFGRGDASPRAAQRDGADDHGDQRADRLPVRRHRRRREDLQLPGLGTMMLNAVGKKDIPVLQTAVLMVGVIYMISTLVADVLIAALNPRVRLGGFVMTGAVVVPGDGAIPPSAVGSPAPISERRQARRENWRLLRRRPSFVIGVAIVFVWALCALLPDLIAPYDPLNFRADLNSRPRGRTRSAPTRVAATCSPG